MRIARRWCWSRCYRTRRLEGQERRGLMSREGLAAWPAAGIQGLHACVKKGDRERVCERNVGIEGGKKREGGLKDIVR